MLTSVADAHFFTRFFPQFAGHFPQLNPKIIQSYSQSQKNEFVELMLTFPLKRSYWVFAVSMIKVLIPGILVVHVFAPAAQSILFNWLCFWLLEGLYILTVFSGLVFTTVSRRVYELFSELDGEVDMSQAFISSTIPPMRSELFMVENITLISSVLAFIALTSASAQTFAGDGDQFSWRLVAILVSGFISIGRVYYVNRRNFIHAMRTIFSRITMLDGGGDRYIPLHADSTLANFESSFNQLIQRLKNRDREIESWMAFQAEQNKMANIGESMSLVTHDMVSPLHAIDFCLDELLDQDNEHLDREEMEDYLAQAKFNLQRVQEMVDSIKYAAKNPYGKERETMLFEAYSYSLQLLKTHYGPREIDSICFYFDPKLVSAKLQISHTNLVHLLYNTLKNAVANLLQHQIESPRVELVSIDSENSELEFIIRDNGTGLSAIDFDRMTSKETLIDTRKGLGMRLTKRIVERYQGDMFVIPNPPLSGTEMYVKIPRSTHEER